MSNIQVKQRSDYTFKHNQTKGRHGWLRLTPAYSVKIVREVLVQFNLPLKIIDPFSGTATTALCAAQQGHQATTVDINPFLQWFGKVKTDFYSPDDIDLAYQQAEQVLLAVSQGKVKPVAPPPIHNIERWWNPLALTFLCRLKGGLDALLPERHKSTNLLLVAFCRTIIKLSNAAFNHQSMSFKDTKQIDIFENLDWLENYDNIYRTELDAVLTTALNNPQQPSQIIGGDARHLNELTQEKFDLLLTSPPYPNRMSYIRELRPYMYWLGYLKESREAGELDWQAIGGTWGIATSRLLEWQPKCNEFAPRYFTEILDRISHSNNKNGVLLSNYVAKYFEDIWTHLKAVRKVMNHGGKVHYIVGNSTFYGILLPTERLYADMLKALVFKDIKIQTVRKRNSKKELFEFDVSARLF
ncbi:MAG: DNA methyltransferase [Symploca sp. SIO2D2]|nr:DNA methyltransferase [Symploca sp. SIO2D2]